MTSSSEDVHVQFETLFQPFFFGWNWNLDFAARCLGICLIFSQAITLFTMIIGELGEFDYWPARFRKIEKEEKRCLQKTSRQKEDVVVDEEEELLESAVEIDSEEEFDSPDEEPPNDTIYIVNEATKVGRIALEHWQRAQMHTEHLWNTQHRNVVRRRARKEAELAEKASAVLVEQRRRKEQMERLEAEAEAARKRMRDRKRLRELEEQEEARKRHEAMSTEEAFESLDIGDPEEDEEEVEREKRQQRRRRMWVKEEAARNVALLNDPIRSRDLLYEEDVATEMKRILRRRRRRELAIEGALEKTQEDDAEGVEMTLAPTPPFDADDDDGVVVGVEEQSTQPTVMQKKKEAPVEKRGRKAPADFHQKALRELERDLDGPDEDAVEARKARKRRRRERDERKKKKNDDDGDDQ